MIDDVDIFPPVDTLRLRLRCAEPRDAPALAAMMSETVSRRLASWPVPYTAPWRFIGSPGFARWPPKDGPGRW